MAAKAAAKPAANAGRCAPKPACRTAKRTDSDTLPNRSKGPARAQEGRKVTPQQVDEQDRLYLPGGYSAQRPAKTPFSRDGASRLRRPQTASEPLRGSAGPRAAPNPQRAAYGRRTRLTARKSA